MISDSKEIGRRIRQIRGELNGEAFGKILGLSRAQISVYERGEGWPNREALDKILTYGRKSADWLLYGKGDENTIVAEPPEQYSVTLPVRAMAGAGVPCCIDELEPIGSITLDKSYDGPNIHVLSIRGNSMEPTIMDGAHVGIDITAKEIISGQMYAVFIPHEGIVVKRIWLGPELIKISSDNPSAPDHDMIADRINWDTFVQGRVKWTVQKY